MRKGSVSQVSDSFQALSHLALEVVQFKDETGTVCLGSYLEPKSLVPAGAVASRDGSLTPG